MLLRVCGLVLCFLFGVKPALAAPESVRLAVSYFDNASTDSKYAPWRTGIAQMLITDLAVSDRLVLVERDRVNEVLQEIELQQSPYFDQATAAKLGAGLGAELILTGSYIVAPPNLRIDARVVDVETSEILVTVKAEGATDDIMGVHRTLTTDLLKALGAEVSILDAKSIGRGGTDNMQAFALYSQGLVALDAGAVEQARTILNEALSADDDFRVARIQRDQLAAAEASAESVMAMGDNLMEQAAHLLKKSGAGDAEASCALLGGLLLRAFTDAARAPAMNAMAELMGTAAEPAESPDVSLSNGYGLVKLSQTGNHPPCVTGGASYDVPDQVLEMFLVYGLGTAVQSLISMDRMEEQALEYNAGGGQLGMSMNMPSMSEMLAGQREAAPRIRDGGGRVIYDHDALEGLYLKLAGPYLERKPQGPFSQGIAQLLQQIVEREKYRRLSKGGKAQKKGERIQQAYESGACKTPAEAMPPMPIFKSDADRGAGQPTQIHIVQWSCYGVPGVLTGLKNIEFSLDEGKTYRDWPNTISIDGVELDWGVHLLDLDGVLVEVDNPKTFVAGDVEYLSTLMLESDPDQMRIRVTFGDGSQVGSLRLVIH